MYCKIFPFFTTNTISFLYIPFTDIFSDIFWFRIIKTGTTILLFSQKIFYVHEYRAYSTARFYTSVPSCTSRDISRDTKVHEVHHFVKNTIGSSIFCKFKKILINQKNHLMKCSIYIGRYIDRFQRSMYRLIYREILSKSFLKK